MKRRHLLVVLISAAGLSSCKEITGSGCIVAYPAAFDVTIRDQEGRSQALGSVVTFTWGSNRYLDSTLTDSLNVRGGGPGVSYDIQVAKRYYRDTLVSGAYSRDLGCGNAGPGVTVPVVLSLVAGAPPVRSLYLLPPGVLLDRGKPPFAFAPVLDANTGLSRSVRWSIAGDTGSVTFDAASGTLTYRCLPKSGYLTMTATSLADSSVAATAAVAVQGHPAASNDPPCG